MPIHFKMNRIERGPFLAAVARAARDAFPFIARMLHSLSRVRAYRFILQPGRKPGGAFPGAARAKMAVDQFIRRNAAEDAASLPPGLGMT